jgi:hypothetical protein
MALKYKKDYTEIRVLQADKGYWTVIFNESSYNEKISSLPESEIYETLRRVPSLKLRGR